ncbi:hypothetical protein PV797_01955 [Clostridiaceae bacterium M8S5]|nr:hypothetical protein PV797_01955 [Clostridiaceae bacterium M8S5]
MHTHKNARENVECVLNKLHEAQSELNSAVSTVEKAHNKENIQGILNSVNQAVQHATTTLNTYQES